ncbi:LacI family DNA-binding transcriptional regulator (plasmid) [Shinella sumterensis]|uniref:LacI family DNA-binding transcriptional regulator n=1 Tax=Shinella sumterensis TaxID=1967501 RepID=UPI001E4DE9E3|nr:LacI family DNA-binding transcriptional regulator [Shinella sumterensis]WLS10215.1 LacI family DNA-binding transcriptional regulator [Shinella sumterensis]
MTKLRPDGTVTMQSVAVAAGVSPMTVSNSFRYPQRVHEETRERVLQIAAELGYVPNHAAGNLASGQSRVIGAVIPSIKNSSFYNYVRGMQEHVADNGYQLILKLADSLEQEAAAIRTLIGLRVAGIALVGDEHEDSARTLLKKTGVPVVEAWVHRNPFDMAVGYSTIDATRAIVELLIVQGYTRIGFVGYEGDVSHRFTERLPAFIQCVEQAGLSSHRIFLIDQAHGFGAGPKALEGLCSIDPELDAIICPTDIVAAGVLFECGRRGWKVPERLAVAGWGDYEIASEITPGITSVHPHAYEMGQNAMSLIIERANGNTRQQVTVDTGFHIVERAST